MVSSGSRLSGGILRSSSECLIALISKLSAGLFGTMAGDVSPPLSNASRESTRRLPLSLSLPWHLKQTSTSTGRILVSKSSAAAFGSWAVAEVPNNIPNVSRAMML